MASATHRQPCSHASKQVAFDLRRIGKSPLQRMAQGPQGQQQGFPQKMTVTYSDYKFDAVDEAKGEAKPEAKPDAKPAAKPDAPAAAEDKW